MLLVVLVKKKKEKENHFRRGHFESDASNTFQQRWERAVYPCAASTLLLTMLCKLVEIKTSCVFESEAFSSDQQFRASFVCILFQPILNPLWSSVVLHGEGGLILSRLLQMDCWVFVSVQCCAKVSIYPSFLYTSQGARLSCNL